MPTSSGKARTAATLALAAALGTACSDDGPVRPPLNAECDGVSREVLALAPLEGRVVTGEAVHCLVLAGGGATYLVMPQLTGASLPYGGYGFRLGDPEASPAVALRDDAALARMEAEMGGPIVAGRGAQAELDGALRARERRESIAPRARAATRAASRASLRDGRFTMPSAVGDPEVLRTFSVLSNLDGAPVWEPVGARLRFEGNSVLLYVDTLAQSSFGDDELEAMGRLYDESLAPRIFGAFGEGSDIDANGRVLFLLTPTVNAMVSAAECPTRGYVRGFFHSHDLVSTAPTANGAEVFYGFVPDPDGRWSCAHSKEEVLANLPPTFVHELQHMISFGAHALVRGGAGEEPWLNEGLSHVAEELGSLFYEERFPAPAGRTDPGQLFPDSAAPYINPNLLYSYRFLFSSASYSLTSCAPGSFCSLNERGGAWLLLRWIADQQGDGVLRRLVQTALTGRANLEAVTGASTASLLGDFAIAASADSVEGVTRTAVAPRHRFATRNLRSIYRRLHESYGIAGGIGRPYPIAPVALPGGGALTGTMRPGTFLTYRLTIGESTPAALLRFAVPDGSPFPAEAGAQLSVFRLP